MLQLAKALHPQYEPLDAASQAERLRRAYPLAWVHVPKCGSSLNNMMIHLPGACPGVPNSTVISVRNFGPLENKAFKNQYRPTEASGACGDHFYGWGDHHGVGSAWQKHYKGHGVIMLRQPEQRTMSGFTYGFHSWPGILPPANALQYARKLQGCAVRMLTRGGDHRVLTCGGALTGRPTGEDVDLAIHRLRTGFVFVGLTEKWPLSMCLAHRMFGGPCRLSDFVDSRTTSRGNQLPFATTKILLETKPYSTAPLKGFRDPYDGALYSAAEEIFEQELERYNVSLESCEPCFDEAGISVK